MSIINCEDFFDFCRAYDWKKHINELEEMAIKEKWAFDGPDEKNDSNIILQNYIKHTFKRLYHLCQTPEKEKKYIYCDGKILVFNTGLFTPNYSRIYILFKHEERNDDDKKWSLWGFVEESHRKLYDCEYLPKKVDFFEKVENLIYNPEFELRINASHILNDKNNVERIPADLRNAANLQTLFEGAITKVKKKLESNYKIAVPQYFEGRVQLLLPLCLRDEETVDLVMVVTRNRNSYVGHTCLTPEQAYNNARLIAKPETQWLSRG